MKDDDRAKYAMARTTLVVTYDGAGKPIARGTGFFFRAEERHFVVTNTHVLGRYCQMRLAGREVAVGVAVEYGMPGLESHAGYLLMPQAPAVEDGVESGYGFMDIGLIELAATSMDVVHRHKMFLSASDVRPEALSYATEEVFYRGYPKEFVEFHGLVRGAWADGYTHFTKVTRVGDRNISLDRREERIAFGGGAPDSKRNLRGISGAALLDYDHRLCGVIWGGDSSATWACPASKLLDCIREYCS